MLSRIRIGFLALHILFFLAPFLSFAQGRPEPLPPLDSLNFQAMNGITANLLGTARELERILTEKEALLNEDLVGRQNQLREIKLDTTAPKLLLDSLSRATKEAKTRLKETSQQNAQAKKAVLLTSSMTEMDSLNLRKNLPKAWKQVRQLYDELYPPMQTEKTEGEAVASKTPKPKKEKKQPEPSTPENPGTNEEPNPNAPTANPPITNSPVTTTKKYNSATDVMLSPPTPPCVIASSSRDEFSGEVSRELARAELFRFTNPALKAYLQGKTHVICEAALASTGTKATLLLTFNINDPNARRAFGRLEKNSIATLKFLDGSTFELQNAVTDDGVFNPENDASIFHAQYPLNPEALKKIRRNGLDKIRILWSKGYDDYDVQQVDLLMRQAECLFK